MIEIISFSISPIHQGLVPTLAAMGAGVLKAVLILWAYLNLRRSPSGWKAVFVTFLLMIAVVVLGAYGVGVILVTRESP